MREILPIGILLFACATFDVAAIAPDYAREDRIVAEIAAAIAAWVPIGMQQPFATASHQPVLDLIAQNDLPEVLAVAPARADALPHDGCSRQITIAGTDHFMANRRKELAEHIVRFLDAVSAGRCAR